MTTKRRTKPYIYVTWLAKLLGGQRCVWSAWFKAHYQHDKHEEQGAQLAQWNREHDALMRRRRRELEAEGWTVRVEEDNAFVLEGREALVAGKPDLVAIKGDRALVVDGKTGREREADLWQVLIYLYAVPLARAREKLRPLALEGQVYYQSGEVRDLSPVELDDIRRRRLFDLIAVVASNTPPAKAPSRDECRFCNIGPADCPERVGAPRPIAVGDF